MKPGSTEASAMCRPEATWHQDPGEKEDRPGCLLKPKPRLPRGQACGPEPEPDPSRLRQLGSPRGQESR